MPSPPPGEADLRALTRRFEDAERRVRALVAQAPDGDRRALLIEALRILIVLRQDDLRGPIISAYLGAFESARGADLRVPDDLAASLHRKLDRAAQTAASSASDAITRASVDNVEEMAEAAVTAHTDGSGARWTLGAYAAMVTSTLGRQATTRGLADAVGKGGRVVVEASGCDYCESFDGEATVGTDPMPPFHPSCQCVAVPA